MYAVWDDNSIKLHLQNAFQQRWHTLQELMQVTLSRISLLFIVQLSLSIIDAQIVICGQVICSTAYLAATCIFPKNYNHHNKDLAIE